MSTVRKKRKPRKRKVPAPLETAQGAEEFAAGIFHQVRQEFGKIGTELPLNAFILLTTDDTGKSLDEVEVGHLSFPPVLPIRHHFEQVVQARAVEGKAVGVLVLKRADAIQPAPVTGTALDELLEAQEEELVVAYFEHLRFSKVRCWEASIKNDEIGMFVENEEAVSPYKPFLTFQN